VSAGRPPRRRETGRTTGGLIACLAYAATTGGVVAGLGNPLIHEVSVARGVPVVDAQWVLIATLLVGAVGTPVLSRLADGRAAKAVLVGTLLLLGLGSAVALVPTFTALIAARAVQGVGYTLVPLTVVLARTHLSGATLARTMAVLSVSVSLGVGIGNPAIGLLVDLGGYRLPFLLVTLVGTSAAWWVARRIPAAPAGGQQVALDVPGALLLATGLAALLLVVARGEVWGWATARVAVLAVVGVALLVGWVALELRAASPLVDLRLLADRSLLGANAVAVLSGIGMFAGASTVMLQVQTPSPDGLGLSVFVAGLLMLPMALTSLVTPLLALRLARRVGHRLVLAGGALLVAAAFGYFALWHRSVVDILVMMVVMGAGIGLAYSVMPAIIVAHTPAARTGSAIGVNQVVRLAGGSSGGAVCAAILAAHTPSGALDPVGAGFAAAGAFASAGSLLAAVVCLAVLPGDHPRPGSRSPAGPDSREVTARVTVDTAIPPS
jgi:MFS family permease